MRITFLTVGKVRQGIFKNLYEFYINRFSWDVRLKEVEPRKRGDLKTQRIDDTNRLRALIPKGASTISLDEKGNCLSSRELASWLDSKRNEGNAEIAIIIGGVNGLDQSIISTSDLVMALGRATWPHLLIRGMMAEQLYRAQQILSGHPYHKD
ncbi:MAG: 23S rRNA (pseudouridine(1915)-N(3))-methyltransferase RlmH [Rhodospirillaceae bacterium]|nr:23S rRNA (pseudouridine(1915)-N(3))-methyltransferase RlmH [Rhodospirillaceae bacterium]|tara:strand:+ start:1584 stop:2042 length:459 start_codon:yes stop_codon:yes gene_type:complete